MWLEGFDGARALPMVDLCAGKPCSFDTPSERRICVLDMIDMSTVIGCSQETHTLGLLILRTVAFPVGEYIDIIVTDLMQEQGTARLLRLEEELGAPLEDLEVERGTVNRPHASILGSTSFTFIRVCKAVVG